MVQIKITNRFLSEVIWGDSCGCAFSINSSADIWRINIQSNLSLLQSLSTLLTHDETIKAGRFAHKHDSDRYIISRGAIKLIMGRYLNRKPALIEIAAGENKKPYIKDSPLFYNLSHSGNWIILGVSDSAIGIDTELVNNSFDFSDVLDEHFSPGESRFIKETKSAGRFFMLWTRKEALTKATGKGLDEDLKFIPSLDGQHGVNSDLFFSENNWKVNSFVLSEDYFASTALTEDTGNTSFWETNLFDKNFIFS